MLKELRPAVSLLVVMTVLTGLVYSLTVTGLAGLLFPWQAAGSLVESRGATVGSTLIAQPFTGPDHLQPRPSAAGEGYDAASSGASNHGPTAKALVERVAERAAALRAANPDAPGPVPVELVTASGSGLDPHLSPAAALWQAPRIAKARGLPLDTVRAVIERHTEGRQWGLLGEPRVNVLLVNLALDGLAGSGGK